MVQDGTACGGKGGAPRWDDSYSVCHILWGNQRYPRAFDSNLVFQSTLKSTYQGRRVEYILFNDFLAGLHILIFIHM